MSARELELLRLDVDPEETDAGELLPEDCEDGADSAADLEQACSRREFRAVADQPVPPVLSLVDEALLLPRAVAVYVLGDATRVGSRGQARSGRGSCRGTT